MIFTILGLSLPVWLGFLLVYALAMQLSISHVQAYMQLSQGLLPFPKYLILLLPALTLGLGYTELIARMTRASMLEVLHEDYIRTAHAKGARLWSVPVVILARGSLSHYVPGPAPDLRDELCHAWGTPLDQH
jgi:ABC-type dipeptide/oligopeptide/nickel transport system permease component